MGIAIIVLIIVGIYGLGSLGVFSTHYNDDFSETDLD